MDRCLWAFAKNDWQSLEDKAASMSIFDRATIDFLRGFISSAVECRIKNGRITLPPSLKEDAGLEKEVVLAGQLKKFEIWDRERWEEEFSRVKNSFPESSPSLLELRL
jgi:MraZ protein